MILHHIFLKKYINLIIIICYIQFSLICDAKQHQSNLHKSPIFTNTSYYSNDQYTTIYAESDTIEIYYPKKIQLFGNIKLKYRNNILTSDTLTILNTIHNNQSLYTTLYANGNVHYYNKDIVLSGSNVQFNLNHKNINLHQGKYYIPKFHIHGTASLIMQKENDCYTIMKKSNFTGCKFHNNSWNITGSEMFYDWNKNNIHIWNAYFKINTIPIFYQPYLSLFFNQYNILESYIPTIKYNNKYGLILKIPFPLIFSKHHSGNIIPYYTSNFGIGLQTKIHYLVTLGTGCFFINIIENNNNHDNNKITYRLCWKHHSIENSKWNVNIDYTNSNNLINYNIKNFNKKYFSNTKDHINQKIIFCYNNENWKASIAYLGYSNPIWKNHITQDHCIYSVEPQLEIQFFSNPIWKKKLYFQIFHQSSQFIPSNTIYPKTIRLHIEPILNFTTNNNWGKFNIDTRLKMTYYQQKNINTYNIKKYQQYHLKNQIHRIIPQFKIDRTIIFQKKINTIKSHKYFIESKLQYLYIPYIFQENIGIYDTKIIYKNQKNLFHDMKYSGLDRIQSANQFTGNITIRHFHKQFELFNISIGQILKLNQNNNFTNHVKNIKNCSYKSIFNSNSTLYLSGIGHWNINSCWNIHTEAIYDTYHNQLSSGNTILEYIGKNNRIIQYNYRYISKQCLKNNLIPSNNTIYYQTISQLGIIIYYPTITNWIISYSHYHNIKSNFLIDQTIGIQYSTPCFMFSIVFERNISNENEPIHSNLYDNKIKFNFNLIKCNSNLRLISQNYLSSYLIPYQKIY